MRLCGRVPVALIEVLAERFGVDQLLDFLCNTEHLC